MVLTQRLSRLLNTSIEIRGAFCDGVKMTARSVLCHKVSTDYRLAVTVL